MARTGYVVPRRYQQVFVEVSGIWEGQRGCELETLGRPSISTLCCVCPKLGSGECKVIVNDGGVFRGG